MRNRRLIWLVVLALSASFLVIASSGSAGNQRGQNTKAKAPITIGFVTAMTGGGQGFDVPLRNGAILGFDDMNKHGGILGRRVKYVTVDTRSDFARMPTAALEAIEKHAQIIIPSGDYDFGGPAARVANQHGILAVAGAGSPLFGKRGIGPMMFNTLQTTPTEAAIMATFARNRGWTRAFVLQDVSIEYSKSGCDYFEKAWSKLGGKVVGKATFQNDDPSIAAQVGQIRSASSAQFIALCSWVPGATTAVRQIRGAGVALPIVGQLAVDGRVILGAVPRLNNFYYVGVGLIHGDDGIAINAQIGREYKKKFGSINGVQDSAPIRGYAGAQTIAWAIKQAHGSVKGKDLQKALEHMRNVKLVTGLTTYTPNCHVPVRRGMTVYQVRNGALSVAAKLVKPKYVPPAPC
jgi:branched-chain amino acid transport system substrate-binding protein